MQQNIAGETVKKKKKSMNCSCLKLRLTVSWRQNCTWQDTATYKNGS